MIKPNGNSRVPLGFSRTQLADIKADLKKVIDATRVDGQPITALVQVTGASTTFYSNNPDNPLGHHWDSSGIGKSDYDIDIFSPELAETLLLTAKVATKVATNDEVLNKHGKVFFRSSGMYGFYQTFPQFESLARHWEKELGRAIDLRLKMDLTPVAQLPDPPNVGPGPILLLRSE